MNKMFSRTIFRFNIRQTLALVHSRKFVESILFSHRKANFFQNGTNVRILSNINFDNSLLELETTSSEASRKEHLALAMKNIFQMSDVEAQTVIANNPTLWRCFLLNTFPFLKKIGLTKQSFMYNPWLSAIPQENIKEKLEIIRTVYPEWDDINMYTSLLQYSKVEITKYLRLWKEEAAGLKHSSRFHFMAETLETNVAEILKHLPSRKFLATTSLRNIELNIHHLLEAGANKEDILNDLWLLKFKPTSLDQRLNMISTSKVPFKSWHIHCHEDVFKRSVKIYWNNKEALGDAPDVEAYLCQRLQCTPHTVQALMLRCPRLRSTSAHRLKSKIDLLFLFGITSEQILSCPQIFAFSCERIKSRLDKFKNHNLQVPSLGILCCNDEKINKAIERSLHSKS